MAKFFKAMGVEYKKLVTINYVADTDVSYYDMGEIDGVFDEEELREYIKKYGYEDLCSHLAYLQFQVWNTLRELNAQEEKQSVKYG